MRLLSLIIYKWHPESPKILWYHHDLSYFNYFQRSTIKEHIVFHSRFVCARTSMGAPQSVKFEQDLGLCHAYTHSSGLAATVLCDGEYPSRVAFTLMAKALRGFYEMYSHEWSLQAEDAQYSYPGGVEMFEQFKDPLEADKVLKIQKDLDEVRDVMLKNINDLMQRGETIDALMEKSTDLSTTSYEFYRTAKKHDGCCKW
eukprot:GHVO01069361.1.p1 GENE.GHVO01069361.1~~GHVO01069361.1.p1  ORF type:complete len:200 (+),score=29.98 GHVO01069361.1:18-617(+)